MCVDTAGRLPQRRLVHCSLLLEGHAYLQACCKLACSPHIRSTRAFVVKFPPVANIACMFMLAETTSASKFLPPQILNIRTFVVKFLSAATAVGSGLPVGPEGPMIHMVRCAAVRCVAEVVLEWMRPGSARAARPAAAATGELQPPAPARPLRCCCAPACCAQAANSSCL